MKHTDFMTVAAANWNGLTSKQKEPYEKMAEKDKKRYELQMKEWEENGHYTLEDGTKSSKFAKDPEPESDHEPLVTVSAIKKSSKKVSKRKLSTKQKLEDEKVLFGDSD